MVLKVKRNEERLDKYITAETDYSRVIVSKLITRGLVTVNDIVKKASYVVKEDDIINVGEYKPEVLDLKAEDVAFEIVYEDEYLMVINKPSGLVVHPGNGHQGQTLVNGLLKHTSELSDLGGEFRLGIVHRLDKDTSGLMLVAKTNKAHQILADDFKAKRVKRKYIALLCGVFPHDTATIDAPIGRDKINRQLLTVTAENAKNALTNLKVIQRYAHYTLVELELATGRTHQIRVHMKYIGFPIYNDPVYNKKESSAFGQFLHSQSLTFNHPITKELLNFESPLPKPFQDFIKHI